MAPVTTARPDPISLYKTPVMQAPTLVPASATPLLSGGDRGPIDSFDAGPKVSAQPVSKDAAARKTAIDNMLRGNTPAISAEQRKNIDWAMKALSTKEIQKLDASGMRIWKGRDFPPEFAKEGMTTSHPLTSPAAYQAGAKVLQLNPDNVASGPDILHELGHAKDDALDDPANAKPILSVSGDKRTELLTKTINLASEGKMTFKTQTPNADGKMVAASMTIGEMYEKYKGRTVAKGDRFHSPSQSETYGRKNAKEFFGEAFEVFHGGDPAMQKKLLEQAPEVYGMLEADAKKNGVAVPDRNELGKI